MENKYSFIKNGNKIVPVPTGNEYALIPGQVYDLHFDRTMDTAVLEETDEFKFPKNYYLSDADKKFIKKVTNTYSKTNKLTTGVLFSGLKGSGKSLMAKKTAIESGLPIIVVASSMRSDDIESFFAQINDDVCIIMDEFDKNWYLPQLLSFFDGVKPTCKKLILCTANEEKDIDSYFNGRCSRIRYKRVFTSLDKNIVKTVLSEYFSTDEMADGAAEFCCSAMQVVSYDNVVTFGEEYLNNPDSTFDEILDDLNIGRR